MEISKAGTGAGDLQATGGNDSSLVTPSGDEGIPFGPVGDDAPAASVEGKDRTVEFKCRVIIKGGATLFGGRAVLGGELGSAEDNNKDVTIELEGSATFKGGETSFGGQEVGGGKIGEADEDGGGAAQRHYPASQTYDVAQSGGGSKGS
jgi:hypothetical protein